MSDRPVVSLNETLDIEDVIHGHPHFSAVRSDVHPPDREVEFDTNMLDVYPERFVTKYQIEELMEPNSFDTLRESMVNLCSDGKVMKKIDAEGHGRIPYYNEEDESYVLEIYYAAYTEFDDLPFDVVAAPYKKPLAVKLGCNMVVPGLEMAVKSMRKGEKAKFLIDSCLAFRSGCPPRIPKDVPILFSVELVNIRKASPEDEYDDEIEEPGLEKVLRKAHEQVEKGNKLKREGGVNAAIGSYNRAKSYLLSARLKDADEEENVNKELMHVLSNLAICYWEKEQYKKVCSMFNNARHASPKLAFGHIKLLYHSAKALRMLGDYEEAGKRLGIALGIQPKAADLLREKETLKKTIANHREKEKVLFQKMFSFNGKDVDEFIEKRVPPILEELRLMLDGFLSLDVREHTYDLSFSIDELQLCKSECRKRNIQMHYENEQIRLINRKF